VVEINRGRLGSDASPSFWEWEDVRG